MISFEVKSKLASFKRPDVTTCVKTYPFITRTATEGLIGAILGLKLPLPESLIGIEILNPVRVTRFGLNFLGPRFLHDGSGDNLRRPTNVEVLVEPRYRIYYVGPLEEKLFEKIHASKRIYATYLGNSYFPTMPCNVKIEKVERVDADEVSIDSVVPVNIIRDIPGSALTLRNSGTMFLRHKTQDEYEGKVSFIYNMIPAPVNYKIDPKKALLYQTNENKIIALT